MTISVKDTFKFFGIIVAMCCAAIVLNLFINFDIDLRAIDSIVSETERHGYDIFKLSNLCTCLISGVALVLTTVVMLVFYIGQYISSNSQKFGILKALGYSDVKIAAKCAVFGFCVLVGVIIGVGISWAIMPSFYDIQNVSAAGLPDVEMNFHPALFILLIILPTLFFAALSVGIAVLKLKRSTLALIRGEDKPTKLKKIKESKKDRSFISELGLNILNEKKLLAFFVAFGAFCFSAMIQMGISMTDYADDMMGVMILVIGIVLALVSMYLAMSTVINGNKKKLAMLKVMGYSLKERVIAILVLYHIPALIGFAVGTMYQFGILTVMVNVVFSSMDVKPYSFNFTAFGICFAAFAVVYELINLAYALLIGKSSIKAIMSE